MTTVEIGLLFVIVVMLAFVWSAVGAAYRNGVVDGYGFAKEPDNPGYQAAAPILKCMAHRWPELEEKS